LKRAIDAGVVAGPRLFPSGAMVSQTSGHGDFRFPNQLPRVAGEPLDHVQQVGISALADGVDAVLLRVREQLMKGASQIKMMAGGGVSSLYDPIDSIQYLEEELAAGVRAAADWGTYVCVHVYVPGGMRRAIRAGVRCIEHGQLTDEETVRMMAGEGVWWSLQPFLADEDANPKPDPAQRAQQERIAAGTPQAYEWAQKHGVRTAFGTDILLNPKGPAAQGRQLAKLARFMDPLAALKTATGDAGELLALSGERAPYDGPLGVVAPGALADLLVVDGELETDLSALADPATTLRLIMKDGRIAKRAF
jgi:imidazolonepropionase-like amidohydrolase